MPPRPNANWLPALLSIIALSLGASDLIATFLRIKEMGFRPLFDMTMATSGRLTGALALIYPFLWCIGGAASLFRREWRYWTRWPLAVGAVVVLIQVVMIDLPGLVGSSTATISAHDLADRLFALSQVFYLGAFPIVLLAYAASPSWAEASSKEKSS